MLMAKELLHLDGAATTEEANLGSDFALLSAKDLLIFMNV